MTAWRACYNCSYPIMAKPIKTLELHYPIIQFWIQCSTKFMQVQIFAIFPAIRKNKFPQIKIERVETMDNWSTFRGRPVQLKVAVAFSKIHARRKWNETFQMIFFVYNEALLFRFFLRWFQRFLTFWSRFGYVYTIPDSFSCRHENNSAEQKRTT